MNFLLLGRGSIGRRHESILREMGHGVQSVDTNPKAGATFESIYNLMWRPILYDAMLDCTPPNVRPGWKLVTKARFIEKPLGGDWHYLTEPVQMGFCYRWAPGLAEFVAEIQQHEILSLTIIGGQHLQSWHKEDYRTRKYWGVIQDSLPHSLYIARWILGELYLIDVVASRIPRLDIDVEGVAGVLLLGLQGQPVYLQADYARSPKAFWIEAVTLGGWFRWEFAAKEAQQMYERQMQVFCDVASGKRTDDYPNLADGIAVQELLEQIQAAV